jgi:hypothetical protein
MKPCLEAAVFVAASVRKCNMHCAPPLSFMLVEIAILGCSPPVSTVTNFSSPEIGRQHRTAILKARSWLL